MSLFSPSTSPSLSLVLTPSPFPSPCLAQSTFPLSPAPSPRFQLPLLLLFLHRLLPSLPPPPPLPSSHRFTLPSHRLRRAFLKEDPGIIGTVPVFLLRSCLRSGGVSLPSDEVLTLSQQYRGSDGRFAWLNFCDALESTPVCEMVRPRVRSRLPPGYPRKVAESTSDLIDPTSGRPGTYTVTELFNLKKKQRRGEVREWARRAGLCVCVGRSEVVAGVAVESVWEVDHLT